MRDFILRVLKNGVPTALLAALLGYGLAHFGGLYVDTFEAPRSANPADGTPGTLGQQVSGVLKLRVPVTLGAICFAIVVLFELLGALVRGGRPPAAVGVRPPAKPARAGGMDPDVERLLNQILAQTEAEALLQTPPPVGLTAVEPRTVSTSH